MKEENMKEENMKEENMKEENMEVNVKFPVKIRVADYHDFPDVADFLTDLTGQKIKYSETDDDIPYVGVFYVHGTKNKFNTKDIKNIIEFDIFLT